MSARTNSENNPGAAEKEGHGAHHTLTGYVTGFISHWCVCVRGGDAATDATVLLRAHTHT